MSATRPPPFPSSLSTGPRCPGYASGSTPRERLILDERDEPAICVQQQTPRHQLPRADVVYVHGATFGADLSIFFALDGRSWADSLADAGFRVWGFDFVGYGASDRHALESDGPVGGIDAAIADLHRVVSMIRQGGNRRVVLLAHSRGGAIALRYAAERRADVEALVLFAPIVPRSAVEPGEATAAREPLPSHYPLSVWAQYRRFIEDVPKGHSQVLSEAHMEAWGTAFLRTETRSVDCMPPAVLTPFGPVADIMALWSGTALYDPGDVTAPTLLVRGEWDSLCNDADAERLISGLASVVKKDVKLSCATHVMHLEQRRSELYAEVNRFLQEVLP